MATPIQRTMQAIHEGTVDQVRQLLGRHPALLREHGPSMLAHAAEYDRVDTMAVLVEAGIDVNSVDLFDTPLSSAAHHWALRSVAWLLEHGADIDGRASPNDKAPLHAAIAGGRLDAVQFLLRRGADPNALYGNPARNA